jgi:hypothetical protein
MITTVLRGTGPTTLTKIWYEDGVAVDAGDVTVAIVDAAGNVIQASTPATKTGSGASTAYTYELAIQAAVNQLIFTWTRTDTTAELIDTVDIIGGHLFTVPEIRALTLNAQQTPLASTANYPIATIVAARDRITRRIEHFCDVSFTPRFAYRVLPGSGTHLLEVPDHRVTDVLAATINGAAQTAAEIVPDDRLLEHTGGVWSTGTRSNPRNVTVSYEHGWETPPLDLARAALLLTYYDLVPSSEPARALSVTNEFGNIRLSTPGPNSLSGYPDIDEVINRYTYRSLP